MAKRTIHKVFKPADRAFAWCLPCGKGWEYAGTIESEVNPGALVDLYVSGCEHNAGIIGRPASKQKPPKPKKPAVKRVSTRKKKVKPDESTTPETGS